MATGDSPVPNENELSVVPPGSLETNTIYYMTFFIYLFLFVMCILFGNIYLFILAQQQCYFAVKFRPNKIQGVRG